LGFNTLYEVTQKQEYHTMIDTRRLMPLVVLIFSATANSDVVSDTDLKRIMQDLQSDSALIVEGLLVEDFEVIDAAATRITDHPRIPPQQVALVVSELDSEMPAFKELDTLVHDLALSISAAAREADTASIADDYKKMLDGCLACHAAYRERVARVLSSN